MTTTAIKGGCLFCETCLRDGWGSEATDAEIDKLATATIAKFDELARMATGDDSISWMPATSEIYYNCVGESDGINHGSCFAPLATWADDIDFDAIHTEAREWVMDHYCDICEIKD